MARHICKIAIKTIPRCGWTAIVMLYLGLYMLFPGSQAAQQLYTEKHTPFELIGSTNSTTIDLNALFFGVFHFLTSLRSREGGW